jgi:hypothetical protein
MPSKKDVLAGHQTRYLEARLGDAAQVLVRASGTEPLRRVMVEARQAPQAQACAQRLVDALASWIWCKLNAALRTCRSYVNGCSHMKPLIEKAVFPTAGLGSRCLPATKASAKEMLALQDVPRGTGGEIQLTDAIAQLLRREKVFAFRYAGARYDCGSKLGFLQASVDLGETHPQVEREFADSLAG